MAGKENFQTGGRPPTAVKTSSSSAPSSLPLRSSRPTPKTSRHARLDDVASPRCCAATSFRRRNRRGHCRHRHPGNEQRTRWSNRDFSSLHALKNLLPRTAPCHPARASAAPTARRHPLPLSRRPLPAVPAVSLAKSFAARGGRRGGEKIWHCSRKACRFAPCGALCTPITPAARAYHTRLFGG